MLDITNRQVFHEFDKLAGDTNLGQSHNSAAGVGLSPAKGLMQVAMAQEKLHEAKNGKTTPVGFLKCSVDTEKQAKKRL